MKGQETGLPGEHSCFGATSQRWERSRVLSVAGSNEEGSPIGALKIPESQDVVAW